MRQMTRDVSGRFASVRGQDDCPPETGFAPGSARCIAAPNPFVHNAPASTRPRGRLSEGRVISWSEILIIGVLALLVIGPKDLPKVLRAVSIYIGKARELAREFQSGLDDMVRQAELDDLKKSLTEVSDVGNTIGREVKDSIDPGGALTKSLDVSDIARDSGPEPMGDFRPIDTVAADAVVAEPPPGLTQHSHVAVDAMPESPKPEPAAVPTPEPPANKPSSQA